MHSYLAILDDFCSCIWRMDGALSDWCVQSCVRHRGPPLVFPCCCPPLSLALFLSPSLPLFSSGIPHPPSLYVLPYSLKNQPEEETFTLTENRLTSATQKIALNRDHRLDQGDLSKPSHTGK